MKKLLTLIFLVLAAATWFFEWVWLDTKYADAFWKTIPGFQLLLGFAGALILMGLAKFLAIYWLHRPENYYKDSL